MGISFAIWPEKDYPMRCVRVLFFIYGSHFHMLKLTKQSCLFKTFTVGGLSCSLIYCSNCRE